MLRPDCFGIPALVTPGLAPCKDCSSRQACTLEASSSLALVSPDAPEAKSVRARLTVGQLAPLLTGSGAPKRPLRAEEQARLQALNKRAQALARTLAEGCFFERLSEDLVHGRVTETAKRSVNLAMAMICKGPTPRPALVRAFVEQLNLSPASAQVEASTVIAALEFGRAAEFRAGRLSLTPNRH